MVEVEDTGRTNSQQPVGTAELNALTLSSHLLGSFFLASAAIPAFQTFLPPCMPLARPPGSVVCAGELPVGDGEEQRRRARGVRTVDPPGASSSRKRVAAHITPILFPFSASDLYFPHISLVFHPFRTFSLPLCPNYSPLSPHEVVSVLKGGVMSCHQRFSPFSLCLPLCRSL